MSGRNARYKLKFTPANDLTQKKLVWIGEVVSEEKIKVSADAYHDISSAGLKFASWARNLPFLRKNHNLVKFVIINIFHGQISIWKNVSVLKIIIIQYFFK